MLTRILSYIWQGYMTTLAKITLIRCQYTIIDKINLTPVRIFN